MKFSVERWIENKFIIEKIWEEVDWRIWVIPKSLLVLSKWLYDIEKILNY